MEEENEILGPDQPWSPDMLFTPSVEEEEEEIIEDPLGLRSATKILSGDVIGISDIKDPAQGPSLSDLQETVKIGEEQEKKRKKWEKYTSIAKPNETISDDNYDYKYDDNGIYYYKPKDDEEWKTYTNKNSEGNLSIAGKFGHFDYDKYKEIKIHNEKVEKLAQDINKKNYYGDESLINEDKVNAIRRNLNPVEIDEHVVSVENVNKLSDYINNLSEEDIQEPEMSYADILKGGFLVNLPLDLENAWESTKAQTIDILDKIGGLSGAPSVLTDFLLTGDISEVAFVDPETNEIILLSENPDKWNELNKLKNSGVEIKTFYIDNKEKIGEATDRFLLEQFKKSKNLQGKKIDLGEIVKEFDITKPLDIKFSTGKELIGGIVNAFTGLLATAVPAALTRGYSLIPQIGAPMYVDYNIEKANRLYGDYDDPLSELIKRNETEVETPLILTGMSAGLEYIGLKGIANRILNKTGNFAPFVSLMLTQNKEGLTEVGQLGIEDFNSSMAKGLSLDEAVLSSLQKMASKEGLESYLMGVIAAGGLAAPSTFSQAVLTSGNNLTQVEKYISQINNLQLKKSQSNNSAFRKAMDVEIQSVEENFQNFLNETTNVTNSFTAEEKNQVNGFLDKKRENNLNIQALDNSYALGEITLNEYRIGKAALVNNNKGLSNKINKIFQERKKILEKAEAEAAETVAMGVIPTRRAPRADELALQYQQDPANVDIEALLDQYNKIGLAAIKFDTRKGDMAREDAIAEINKEFAGIMERWSPEQGSFSTFVTANIAPKAQGIYDKYIGKRDVTTLDRPEAREVAAEEIDIDIKPTEVARPKVYPASLEVITENVTPEVRSEQTTMIKDDINRAVATVSTSPKAVATNIVNQIKTKEYRQLLKDKLGRWNTEQYNNNVDRLITKDFIATLPVAQLKRRFPRLFEIEVIDRVPTVKIEDGKRTDFKKPVYRIPAITDAKLETIKDYFKANEKRHQSLMEVLGEGIAIEQMQELRGDQAFMTDLQGRLELKGSNLTAEQFLNEVEYNLDKRNLEDKSLDVVEGTVDSVVNEMITEDNVNDIKADVLSEAISKLETFRKTNLSMNALTGVVEAGLRTLRAGLKAGKSLLSAIKDFTKSIKDFIKKPAVKKPTPKKPEVKKPVERFQKISKSLRTSKEIVERTSSDIVKEKGQQPLPPNWSSMSGKQKINSIMWLRSVLPALGPDFVTANNLAFSSRAMFGIPNRPGSKSMSVDNIRLAIDGKFPETLTIDGKTYKKGSPIPVDSQNNFDSNGDFNAGKVKYNKKVLPKLSTVVNSKTGAPKYKSKTAEQLNKLSKTKAWFEANNPNGTKINYLYDFTKIIENDLQNNPNNLPYWELFLRTSTNNMGHIVRSTAPIVYWSKEDGPSSDFREEHNPPQNNITQLILDMAYKGDVDSRFDLIRYSYTQGKLKKSDDDKINNSGLAEKSYNTYYNSPWSSNLPFIRLINPDINAENGGINTDNYNMNPKGDQIITMSENFGFPSAKNNSDKNKFRNELLYKTWIGEIKLNKALREYQAANKVDNLSFKQVNNNKEKIFGLIKENSTTEQSIVDMGNADQAAQIARDINAPTKGISVFDFDDTLAYSNSKVIVNMPDGTIRKITPAEFAVESENLLEQGAEFDFSEFNKVVEGRKGPLADLALKRQEKFGSGDIFVLTARPQASAVSIKAFLDGIGLNIPLKNITGLADGSPDAKALWILDKAAKGYNDFYFADDALPNVQAVKNILDQVDVKSDIQQAKANKVEDLDKEFNVIIEQQSGKQWYKTYSKARAKTTGKKVGRFEFFIPPSAEDFSGLLYKILPKGEKGDLAKKWFKDNLFDPFNKAEQELISAKITVAQDFQALRQNIDNIPKNLNKPIGIGDFTHSQALRVYIWNMQGVEIPGLSTRDLNRLVEKIEGNADLKVFAEKIAFIQKGKEYPAPGENWIAGNITSDIIQSLNKSGRKQFLQEWQQNVDIIFSDKNLNKLEALYGSNYVIALKNVLGRMKSGSNRPVGANPQVNALLDWLNNSVGAVMFLNMRSAGLQLISSVNFINWSDNNPVAAAKAFANQKQYWSDVMTLLNSDYLVQRRNGLKINVAESEIAEAARKGGMRGAIAYLLNKGFVLTRFADSMAIATGGATFYRNRVDKLLEQVNIDTGKVYTREEAEAQAFEDFYQISEESQQSSRTDRISMQQASSIGRLILNFANTPMQYARIMKKSAMDLKAGRGDWKTNLSKIVYYGFVQNLIFNAMQQAIFALAYGSDDEEERTLEDRAGNIADGMVSSLLRGLGYGGAAVDTVKDVIASLVQQGAKKRPEYEDAVSEVFNFSPAIDSKVRKLRSALRSFSWNMKEMKRRGFSLDNPAYLAVSQIVSSTTNIPLDRAARIMMNIRQALDRQTEVWQKVALLFGYSGWELGLPYWGLQTTADKEAEEDEAIKEKYKNDARKLKTQGFKRVPMTKDKPKGKLYEDYIQVPRPSGEIEYWLTPDSNSLRKRPTNTGR